MSRPVGITHHASALLLMLDWY